MRLGQRGVGPRERLERLTQIVARCREEAGLGEIGPIGCDPSGPDLLLHAFAIGHVSNRRRGQSNVAFANRLRLISTGNSEPLLTPGKEIEPIPIARTRTDSV